MTAATLTLSAGSDNLAHVCGTVHGLTETTYCLHYVKAIGTFGTCVNIRLTMNDNSPDWRYRKNSLFYKNKQLALEVFHVECTVYVAGTRVCFRFIYNVFF